MTQRTNALRQYDLPDGDPRLAHDGYRAALRYELEMKYQYNKAYFIPKTVEELLSEWCCEDACHLKLSPHDIIAIRGGFVQALCESPTRELLMQCLIFFIKDRVFEVTCPIARKKGAVCVDRHIFGKLLCRVKFFDLLAITYTEFMDKLNHARGFEPSIHANKGKTGWLADRTCMAIARIAVDSSLNGQYSPLDGSRLLSRGESKMHFLRVNSRGARIPEKLLREYTDVFVRRRGVDSFMRCDICLTLQHQIRSLENMINGVNNGMEAVAAKSKAAGYTALSHRNKVLSQRKLVLFELFGVYRNKQKELAEAATAENVAAKRLNPEVEAYAIPVDQCVPDEDVMLDRYCEMLNTRAKKEQKPFGITPEDVMEGEIMQLDMMSVVGYITGECNDRDFAELPSNESLQMEEEGDAASDMEPSVGGMDIVDDENARRLKLVTCLEKLQDYRRFHNEHVVEERVVAYSAFETGANGSNSVLCFAADGVSKDKCKLPNKERNKRDETVNRQDCYVTGLQMSVPLIGDNMKKLPSRAEQTTEEGIRKEAAELREKIRANPESFSADVKRENDRAILEFADRDIASATGFSLINHDFIYPYGWGGPPKTDALISNILHVLRSRHVSCVPSCIAIILDNASVNKSIYTLRAFALILELIPRLQEVHLMFATVGHTHNSVDAHFGVLCREMNVTDIGTPQDLVNCMEKINNTNGHLDFRYYEFANAIEKHCYTFSFEYLSNQHYFMLCKDNEGDVRFSNEAFLRNAEPFSRRVNHLYSKRNHLIPLTEAEKASGCYLFLPGEHGRLKRKEFAKTVMPKKRDEALFKAGGTELWRQLMNAGMATEQRKKDLESLLSLDNETDELSLYQICKEINGKTPGGVTNDDTDKVEMLLAQRLRQLEIKHKPNPLVAPVSRAIVRLKNYMINFVERLLKDDDGTMKKIVLKNLRNREHFNYIVEHLESGKVLLKSGVKARAGAKRRAPKESGVTTRAGAKKRQKCPSK